MPLPVLARNTTKTTRIAYDVSLKKFIGATSPIFPLSIHMARHASSICSQARAFIFREWAHRFPLLFSYRVNHTRLWLEEWMCIAFSTCSIQIWLSRNWLISVISACCLIILSSYRNVEDWNLKFMVGHLSKVKFANPKLLYRGYGYGIQVSILSACRCNLPWRTLLGKEVYKICYLLWCGQHGL